MFDQFKKIDLRKVSLQTILGGIAVYVGVKQSGVPDTQAMLAGILSALTSGVAAAQDTRKASAPITPQGGSGQ